MLVCVCLFWLSHSTFSIGAIAEANPTLNMELPPSIHQCYVHYCVYCPRRFFHGLSYVLRDVHSDSRTEHWSESNCVE